MHGGAKRAGAFAVNNANAVNSFRAALREVSRNQITQVCRPKRVEIEFARDGQRHGGGIRLGGIAHAADGGGAASVDGADAGFGAAGARGAAEAAGLGVGLSSTDCWIVARTSGTSGTSSIARLISRSTSLAAFLNWLMVLPSFFAICGI